MAKIDELFKLMNTKGASDLHLITGSRPFLRIHGEIIEQVDHQLLENDELQSMLYEIAPENKIKVFEEMKFIKKNKLNQFIILIYFYVV